MNEMGCVHRQIDYRLPPPPATTVEDNFDCRSNVKVQVNSTYVNKRIDVRVLLHGAVEFLYKTENIAAGHVV